MKVTELRKRLRNFKVNRFCLGGYIITANERTGYAVETTDDGNWYVSRSRRNRDGGWIGTPLKPEFKTQSQAFEWLYKNKLAGK